MASKPSLQVRNVSLREPMQDYMAALKAISFVRRALFGLLLLTLLLPIAIFGGVTLGMLSFEDSAAPAVDAPAAAQSLPDPELAGDLPWLEPARLSLQFAAPLARLLAVLLVAVHFLTTNVCLSGRLGGANHAVRGFFWAVLLMVAILPISSLLGIELPAAFYDLDALRRAVRQPAEGWIEIARHYSQFLALPVLALLIALIADSRFGRCYDAVLRRIQQESEINVH